MGAGNFAPTGIFFCFFVRAFLYFSFCPSYLLSTFISSVLMSLFPIQHTIQTSMHLADLFFCILLYCLYFIRTWLSVFIVLHFAFCLYLLHTTQISMPPAGFEPAIRTTADLRLIPHGNRDRLYSIPEPCST